MAANITDSLREQLSDPQEIRSNDFQIVRDLSNLLNNAEDRSYEYQQVQQLLLRALEYRRHFNGSQQILDDLVRKVGLYPYLQPKNLNLKQKLAYEMHRPANFDPEIVFHKIQAKIYYELLDGENVILSAPTSFGKSLIIDALIASWEYDNLVIVVPTIALIDETRRRLFNRFKNDFKIITHPGQSTSDKNIFVLTQERVVDIEVFPDLDLFVIDEFYKLDPTEDTDRSNILNQAFYKLWKTGAQFYLLGPNIKSIPDKFEGYFSCKFIDTDYSTVVTDVKKIAADKDDRPEALVNLAKDFEEPTLIYCQSPPSTNRVASHLLNGGIGEEKEELQHAYDWVANEFHPDWIVTKGLRKGIGIHHGRVPRALAQYLVRAFNNGHLDYLVCTSTLIEGVNTTAKNVVVYDHKLSTKNLDYFTFNNIRGRSGRMFEHFIGKVYVFKDPPEEEFPFVDVPIITQDEETAESLLIQLEEEDLTEESKQKLDDIYSQELLPRELLKSNNGVEPRQQLNLAEELLARRRHYEPYLNWTRLPEYDQLKIVCELIWEYLIPDAQYRAGVSSGSQLCYKINRFQETPFIKQLISFELGDNKSPDDAVEDALHFVRYWVTYHFPRLLMTVNNIQNYLLGSEAGDYSFYASNIENFFLLPGAAELEEYGIPIQVTRKILPTIQPAENLDEVIQKLRMESEFSVDVHPFEREMLRDALSYI